MPDERCVEVALSEAAHAFSVGREAVTFFSGAVPQVEAAAAIGSLDEVIAAVQQEQAFKAEVLQRYNALGIRLQTDKSAVMRALGAHFGKPAMQRVYTIIAFEEGLPLLDSWPPTDHLALGNAPRNEDAAMPFPALSAQKKAPCGTCRTGLSLTVGCSDRNGDRYISAGCLGKAGKKPLRCHVVVT